MKIEYIKGRWVVRDYEKYKLELDDYCVRNGYAYEIHAGGCAVLVKL